MSAPLEHGFLFVLFSALFLWSRTIWGTQQVHSKYMLNECIVKKLEGEEEKPVNNECVIIIIFDTQGVSWFIKFLHMINIFKTFN